jgi:2-C-methyl-D-erythritol 4-phosphate cytidylyltransferase
VQELVKVGVVIPAAGRGVRMGPGGPKQFLELEGRPVIAWTIEPFQRCAKIDSIVLVAGEEQIESMRKLVSEHRFSKVFAVVPGGARRQDSVLNGLRSLEERGAEIVLVHDAVRPFIDGNIIHELLAALSHSDAALAAIPAKDTIKLAGADRVVRSTPPREELWIAQTPQAFRVRDLRSAFDRAAAEAVSATDEASLVERLGKRVAIVQGRYENIKITTPEDYELARLIAARRRVSAQRP